MPKTLNASENSRTFAGNAAPLIGAHKINSLKTFKTNSIVRGAWVRVVDLRLIKSTLAGGFDPTAAGGGYRPASVLVVIYGSEPRVIMTEKPRSLKIHAGEISFPGGKREGRDRDLLDTALRETAEEIGLAVRREQGHRTAGKRHHAQLRLCDIAVCGGSGRRSDALRKP